MPDLDRDGLSRDAEVAMLVSVNKATLLVLVGCATLIAACSARQCKLIGCTNGVSITLAEEFSVTLLPVEVTVCADEVCNSETITASQTAPDRSSFGIAPSVALSEHRERDVTVSLQIRSIATGSTLISAKGTGHLLRSQPNGPGCGPTCYGRLLRYDNETNALVEL